MTIEWDKVKRHYYSYEQEAETLAYARSLGMSEFQVSYGGVRMMVRHVGATLIEIRPKSGANRCDVGVNIVPPDGVDPYGEVKPHYNLDRLVRLHGELYEWGNRGNSKVVEAIAEIFLVWRAKPDRDTVYKVVGGKTHNCAMCGCDLTDELSTSRGIGPECWKHLGRGEVKQAVRNKRASSV